MGAAWGRGSLRGAPLPAAAGPPPAVATPPIRPGAELARGAQRGTPGGGAPRGRRGVDGEGGAPERGSPPGQAPAPSLAWREAGGRGPGRTTPKSAALGEAGAGEGAPGGAVTGGGRGSPRGALARAERGAPASGKWPLRRGGERAAAAAGRLELGAGRAAALGAVRGPQPLLRSRR